MKTTHRFAVPVFCDDSAHPTELTREGLMALNDGTCRFHWIENPASWSLNQLHHHPLVVISKANHCSSSDTTPWATETEGRAFSEYVANGGNLLVLHSGSALYDACPSLCRLMGGTFVHHPPQCPVTIEPTVGHALTIGCSTYTLQDEHYQIRMHGTDVDLFLNSTSVHGSEPAGWTRKHGNGRVCVLTPGHNIQVRLHPSYQNMLQNCLDWCLHKT